MRRTKSSAKAQVVKVWKEAVAARELADHLFAAFPNCPKALQASCEAWKHEKTTFEKKEQIDV